MIVFVPCNMSQEQYNAQSEDFAREDAERADQMARDVLMLKTHDAAKAVFAADPSLGWDRYNEVYNREKARLIRESEGRAVIKRRKLDVKSV